ncbi:hypothetical protein FY534_13295 [Alicyclobacillus sp. TC]|uniref:lysine 5,6-aminomutase reactivase subunit KamB n=1 Tax=Alicyclobacillus sp. TC TaxID=2606450 RepID=UPI0019329425|nr:hypothetical protein [Alicyclobacillus sp. TC]QRF24493.1 hypothetical protein FY534_13295 [Alicyclobacillus sp. TC]
MEIYDRAVAHGWNRIAFMGASKHAGKTTAFNAFLQQAAVAGRVVGLCSIGVDGERQDALMGIDKPPIFAPQGALLATAERALFETQSLEWLESTGIRSPLGEVVIVRAAETTQVLLAGVRSRQHISRVLEGFARYQVDMVLVDGALNRIAAASPELVDAVVLAVSPVSGSTPDAVAQVALELSHRFFLPEVPLAWRNVLDSAHQRRQVALYFTTGEYREFSADAATLHPERLLADARLVAPLQALYVPGAVQDKFMETILLQRQEPMTLIAAHPAQVWVSRQVLLPFYRAGHQLMVMRKLPLLGVAVNPHHVSGADLPLDEMLQAVSAALPEVPVYHAALSMERNA